MAFGRQEGSEDWTGSTASPCSPSGETCLHQAAALGQRTICHYIVEAGASLMKTDQQVSRLAGQAGDPRKHMQPFPKLQPGERGVWGRAASGDSKLSFNQHSPDPENLSQQELAAPEGRAPIF